MAIVSTTELQCKYGRLVVNSHEFPSGHCLSFVFGEMGKLSTPDPLVRFHSSCLFGEVMGDSSCDCAQQLDGAFKLMADQGRGVLVYTFEEGRGAGISQKVRGMEVQRVKDVDTFHAYESMGLRYDLRTYAAPVAALLDLNIHSRIRLITNNPEKVAAAVSGGFIVTDKVEIRYSLSTAQAEYLQSKCVRMGHSIPWLSSPEEAQDDRS